MQGMETESKPIEAKPGERVEDSGIYRVIHDRRHFHPHEVMCIEGKAFPSCRRCGDSVRFELVRTVLHIEDHPLF
jgi:hypothetical protein